MILLSTAYLAPIHYYSKLFASDEVMIEQMDHYVKQTYRNRCVIAAPDGPLALTIPTVKPDTEKAPVRDIRISDHGNWRHLHWRALQSAYGRTPFFEFYEDDFRPFFQPGWEYLADFNRQLLHTVCGLIGFRPRLADTTAFRRVPDWPLPQGPERPYYQVFAPRHGFLPGLSIVDLLFNMGPESILYL